MNGGRNKLAMRTDDATTTGLSEAIQTLLPALERFLQFAGLERTARERAAWSAQLEEPLPQTGAGADAVLALLRDVVIPNGLRMDAPGFSGWVATMPTTLPAAASIAGVIAGSGYQCIQAFNLR
jgi:aromatic-L-amino-acid/L-tryptophan decarboxylase